MSLTKVYGETNLHNFVDSKFAHNTRSFIFYLADLKYIFKHSDREFSEMYDDLKKFLLRTNLIELAQEDNIRNYTYTIESTSCFALFFEIEDVEKYVISEFEKLDEFQNTFLPGKKSHDDTVCRFVNFYIKSGLTIEEAFKEYKILERKDIPNNAILENINKLIVFNICKDKIEEEHNIYINRNKLVIATDRPVHTSKSLLRYIRYANKYGMDCILFCFYSVGQSYEIKLNTDIRDLCDENIWLTNI